LIDEIRQAGPRPAEIVVLADPPAIRSAQGAEDSPNHDGNSVNGKMEHVLERTIDLGSLPVIRSHVIDGHAVLPMALILEWLAESALHRHPGMCLEGIDQLRLFKGVVLRGQGSALVSFRVGRLGRKGNSQAVPVEMHGVLEGGREVTHARCDVLLGDSHAAGERTLRESKLLPLAVDRDDIYRQILFHGQAMQAIQHVEGVDDQTIAARVSTSPPPASWMDRPLRQNWLTDPLAIDAAFQLLVLWTRERVGAASLPTALGSYRQFCRAFPTDGVRVVAVIRQFSDHRAVADIEFLDSRGKAVARIESYECVIDSSLNQAFRRNRLSELQVISG
jgi:hypothetical protein